MIDIHSPYLRMLRVYAVTVRPHGEELWSVSLSGYGDNVGSCAPTWQSAARGPSIDAAFEQALGEAQAKRDAANARHHDPVRLTEDSAPAKAQGQRTPRRRNVKKLSREELDALLAGMAYEPGSRYGPAQNNP